MPEYSFSFLRTARWAGLVLCLGWFPALGLPESQEQAPAAPLATVVTLQGKVIIAGSEGLRISTSSGDVAVTSDSPQVLRTLQDMRLAGREVKLEGQRTSNREFNAAHILTMRDGNLYRLRYYCHVCNIPATEPGPCVCCQRPTELEEIPVGDVTKDMVLVP